MNHNLSSLRSQLLDLQKLLPHCSRTPSVEIPSCLAPSTPCAESAANLLAIAATANFMKALSSPTVAKLARRTSHHRPRMSSPYGK